MNMVPVLINLRSQMANKFFTLQTAALRETLWAMLIGTNTKLATFPEQAPEKGPNRRFIGVQEIPVEQIVGTMNRSSDFDQKFRPLKSYLRDRWVNISLAFQKDGWSPIIVHKVGENYYVEDGHHRVSVARSLGMAFIQAKIWEYPVQANHPKKCRAEPCAEKSTAQAYALP